MPTFRGSALVVILLVVGGLLALVAIRMDWDLHEDSLGASGAQRTPGDWEVRRAAFHDGRLWVLTHDGRLWSLGETEAAPRRELDGVRVTGLCGGDRLEALTEEDGVWSLRRRQGDAWPVERRVRRADDFALTLVCGDSTLLLTDRRLIDMRAGTLQARLQKRLPTFPDTRETRVGNDIYFSTNFGESGTMFYRIGAADGSVVQVRDNGVDESCGSLINGCMQVTATVRAPWNPDCLVLSQRSSHMGPGGRVTELCGGSARKLHEGPCFWSPDGEGCTEEFNSVMVRGGAVLAAGSNGMVELGPNGLVKREPLPEMQTRGHLHVGFAPDFVVVNEAGLPRRDSPLRLVLVPRPA